MLQISLQIYSLSSES